MDGSTIASIVTLGILAIGAISGGIKGFARQVIELVGLAVSFLVAAVTASWIAHFLAGHMSIPHAAALVISFAAVFVGGLIGFHFVAITAQRFIHTTLFGWVDRLCGAAIGLLVATLVASLLASAVMELPITSQVRAHLEDSSVVRFIQPIAGGIYEIVMPEDRGPYA